MPSPRSAPRTDAPTCVSPSPRTCSIQAADRRAPLRRRRRGGVAPPLERHDRRATPPPLRGGAQIVLATEPAGEVGGRLLRVDPVSRVQAERTPPKVAPALVVGARGLPDRRRGARAARDLAPTLAHGCLQAGGPATLAFARAEMWSARRDVARSTPRASRGQAAPDLPTCSPSPSTQQRARRAERRGSQRCCRRSSRVRRGVEPARRQRTLEPPAALCRHGAKSARGSK